jgi:hypothetical protein
VIYFCGQSNRRELVLQTTGLNGIDYLEVLGDPGCGNQLALTFLKDAQGLGLAPDNVSITGGATVTVTSIAAATPDEPTVVTANLDGTGDFSTYTLALVAAPGVSDPPRGLDPQLSRIDFSFKGGCPTPADCLPVSCCPSPHLVAPDINYLAKDYDGFRQVMLDRLAVLTPDWTERHSADLGIAIVETLAYAGDHLSYQQDAVSTEAYIGTARSRISLRRHARLVDYRVGEGCNARAFVVLTVGADNVPIPTGTLFYVGVPGLPAAAQAADAVAQQLQRTTGPVFSSMQDSVLRLAHNAFAFYTWGDADCCLPPGATQATLAGSVSTLKPGDMLILEELVGPDTGQPEDADPTHRCAVCLTSVTVTDHLGLPLVDPVSGALVTEIAWAAADALTFPLCISSTADAKHGSLPVNGVSVARGNVILADHGTWIGPPDENLGTVPSPPPTPDPSAGCTCTATSAVTAPIPRFYPNLVQSPLTFSVPLAGVDSAAAFLAPDKALAAPNISVHSDDGNPWTPQQDLLSSGSVDREFVTEIEVDGTVFLRFGDGQYGMAADSGLTFFANYRTGNGSAGNIGRDTLGHAVLPSGWLHLTTDIVAVRNPLVATGGTDPEDIQHIAQFAPFAYQTQERCVTEADYGLAVAQIPGIAEAKGTMRWTGAWYTAFVSIEPTAPILPPALIDTTTSRLDLLRMMGTDVAVEGAVIVGLQIALDVCVDPQHFQGDVFAALMRVFVTGEVCDGSRGLLNPSNFSFGQTVYASPLIAAAQAVPGVRSATLTTFTRMDAPWVDGAAQGYLTMGRLDIPRCDNDPNHLDHGTLSLTMDGGK